MKPHKYEEFRIAMTKTEARHILDTIIKKYQIIRKQNAKMLERYTAIVHNQKHYLRKRLQANKTQIAYEKSRMKFLRDFNSTKSKVDRLLGRVYVDESDYGEPKYFLKMSKKRLLKLLAFIDQYKPSQEEK